MKTIIHDMGEERSAALLLSADRVICANGRYAPCKGCFKCWTKHPAQCAMKDVLHDMSRVLGASEDITIITKNCWGTYSAAVKNILDRSIGMSTPMSTYRGGQMHHTLRYGKRNHLRVIVWGEISAAERDTFTLIAQRNAVNMGFRQHSIEFCRNEQEAEAKA